LLVAALHPGYGEHRRQKEDRLAEMIKDFQDPVSIECTDIGQNLLEAAPLAGEVV